MSKLDERHLRIRTQQLEAFKDYQVVVPLFLRLLQRPAGGYLAYKLFWYRRPTGFWLFKGSNESPYWPSLDNEQLRDFLIFGTKMYQTFGGLNWRKLVRKGLGLTSTEVLLYDTDVYKPLVIIYYNHVHELREPADRYYNGRIYP